MAEQERKTVQRKGTEADSETVRPVSGEATAETTERIDELLDEIDEVLEENAEEFVKNYVQKGGQ
ncbi:MAG: ubiquitin-like protein Pup [Acidimicrobiia bacterium]